MKKDITTEEWAVCFRLLDEYARTNHNCFVAELFLSTQSEVYVGCFRAAGLEKDSPNRYACKYLQFGVEDIRAMSSANCLSVPLAKQLDDALSTLPQTE